MESKIKNDPSLVFSVRPTQTYMRDHLIPAGLSEGWSKLKFGYLSGKMYGAERKGKSFLKNKSILTLSKNLKKFSLS